MTLIFPCVSDNDAHLPAWDVLSRREQEIAELVSQGLTNKQIAERAFISENTVKQHLKRVFNKTDVRNRAELMQRIWAAGDHHDARPEPSGA
jgi:DNA-binding CsgD family transcriptional regulator